MVGWFTNTQKSSEVMLRDDGSPFYDYVPALGEERRATTTNAGLRCHDGLPDGRRLVAAARRAPQEGDGQWCLATDRHPDIRDFLRPEVGPNRGRARPVGLPLVAMGRLMNLMDTNPAAEGEQIGCAIAIRFTLQPGESRQIPIVLAWDLPVTEFAAGVQAKHRRYTDFFRPQWAQCQGHCQSRVSKLSRLATVRSHTWQQPILDRQDLPDWFKMALFNELYDLASGGTLWSAATEADPVGQFAVLECLDYRWYESLDVRLYGGFATLLLWPELEKAVLRAFARAIPQAG
jgi:non-lysosomal glucosylceramidase